MTPEDEKFERIAQRHIADLKKSSKAIVEDAAVRAMRKVMSEFAQGAHTEAKIEYHTKMIQCPHCDGPVRVPAQPYPDNFIDALKYDVARRDSEAQPEQEPFGHVTVRRLSQRFENHHDQFQFYPAGQSPYLDNVDECYVVYTTPPQRKPLTDEEIDLIGKRMFGAGQAVNTDRDFARAIEAAHGIKE